MRIGRSLVDCRSHAGGGACGGGREEIWLDQKFAKSYSEIPSQGESIMSTLTGHAIVSAKEWLAARQELLKKEKEFTRLRDELSRKRRELPWERVEKKYVFEGPNGKVRLADLF